MVRTSELVEFEGEGYGEEEELVGDCDQQGYCEIIVIQYVYFSHICGQIGEDLCLCIRYLVRVAAIMY